MKGVPLQGMKRYFLEVAYKGTNYSGLQIQKNTNSIQQEVNKALSTVYNVTLETTSASRTDAGVHALQNYFHFDTEEDLPSKLVYRMNQLLPKDILIKKVIPVKEDKHARFDAVERSYIYRVHFGKNPFLDEYSYRYKLGSLDMDKMNQASEKLLVYQDFASFCKAHSDVKTTLCDVKYAQWKNVVETNYQEEQLQFNVTANRFLRGMVRGLVGTLLRVGKGMITVSEFESIILAKELSKADFTPPPQGLFLASITYTYIGEE